ncbi:hypothetical protein A3Q56_03622 [Intoshia linei]|uniref:PiggyBac transposable element-derived protein domain-containing protein n=1 Tax=Intoshia linei TaxID=1819745 RepID=A0A177B2J6_9BILA|nr:hypothetical protein A3Q56_03622 [Intoshia linei]
MKLPQFKLFWSSPIFKQIKVIDTMSYEKFNLINSNISCLPMEKSDKKRIIPETTSKIITYINELCHQVYSSSENLSIDEGIIKFKGRVHFKTFNSMKPIKVGLKM